MESRTYNDIMEELGQLEATGIDVSKYQKRANELMEEFKSTTEKARREARIVAMISCIFCILIVAFAAIVNLSNLSLKKDVSDKNAIIENYEQMVRTLGIDTNRNSKQHKTNGSLDSNELINENYQLLRKISVLENKMKLIKHEYGIKVIDDGKSYYLQANKVDSALMLLDVYRDKIYYDVKKKEWIVVSLNSATL